MTREEHLALAGKRAMSKSEHEAALDEAVLGYIRRRYPVPTWSVGAHAELHSVAEVEASLLRLRRRGEVQLIAAKEWDAVWIPLTTEDDCRACEILRTTYQNPKDVTHTCIGGGAPRR